MHSRDRTRMTQARQRIRQLTDQVELLERRLSVAADKQILLLNRLIEADATIERLQALQQAR